MQTREGRLAAEAVLRTRAPAKVNLTLHVLGRRADGYHELESLVAFADVADDLELVPGEALSLFVDGPNAPMAGPNDDNLVLRAARALVARRPGLILGTFRLTKRLPAAAGIGGGSSDAAAALRLLAQANGLAPDHEDVVAAARATGADVPVCLDPRARMMCGAGEEIGPALDLPPLHAVLVNPGVAVPTPSVFRALGLAPGETAQVAPHPEVAERSVPSVSAFHPESPGKGFSQRRHAEERSQSASRSTHDRGASFETPAARAPQDDEVGCFESGSQDEDVEDLLGALAAARNDLEPPALALAPAIGEALARLRATPGCRVARMSGSGATVFGLYGDRAAAAHAGAAVGSAEPRWWVKPAVLR